MSEIISCAAYEALEGLKGQAKASTMIDPVTQNMTQEGRALLAESKMKMAKNAGYVNYIVRSLRQDKLKRSIVDVDRAWLESIL